MLDMGFYDDIMQIVKQLPAKRQNMRKVDVNLEGAMQEAMMPDESDMAQEPTGDELQEAIRNNRGQRIRDFQ